MYYSCAPFERIRKIHILPHMMGKIWEDTNFFFPIEVIDKQASYLIKAALPGLDSDGISIEVNDGILAISGEFNPKSDESEKYLLREIPYGKFHRTIHFPTAVDSDKAEATMEKGILMIEIPKAEEAKPRQIKVTK